MIRQSLFAVVLGSVMLTGLPAAAQSIAPPSGKVVLAISGQIDQTNAPDGALLDLAALKKFPAREIRTKTYWHEGEQTFRGVSALEVLDSIGLKGTVLTATAADTYTVEIPLAELKAYEPIFAMELNGEDLAGQAEGPVWLVFPYDDMTEEERERYTAWSIWALETIKVQN